MSDRQRSRFILVELLVVVLLIVLLVSMVPCLSSHSGEPATAAFCSNNLAQFLRAAHIYADEYKTFPPHNPLPGCWPQDDAVVRSQGAGFDPNIGWLMTCAMRMTPPARFASGHFQWFALSEDELPDIVVCPAANRKLLFKPNPEIDTLAPWETFIYQYAAFYQTSGTVRAATPLQSAGELGGYAIGGRNPPVPDPSSPAAARPCRNAVRRMPSVRVPPLAPVGGEMQSTAAMECWVQATRPDEIDSPGRVYYMADSREYRLADPAGSDLPAATNDGWLTTRDSKVLLGTRHHGWANVAYMDGHVNRDRCAREPSWNLDYDAKTRQARGTTWRASTFEDTAPVAGLGTQHHLMPALTVGGCQGGFGDAEDGMR